MRRQIFHALKALDGRGEILTLRRAQPLSRLDYSSSTRSSASGAAPERLRRTNAGDMKAQFDG